MALLGLVPLRVCQYFLISTFLDVANALDYCDQNYWCKEGHCCGNGRCCTYYYELWWFWLIWVVIGLMTCCCFYQQRRLKKRRRRHSSSRRSRDRSSSRSRSQPSTTQSFFRPLFDPSKQLKLPTYEEVQNMPQEPPAYDVLYESTLEESNIGVPSSLPHPVSTGANTQTIEVHDEVEIDESQTASLLNNEEPVAVEMELSYLSVLPPSYTDAITRGVLATATSSQTQELPDGALYVSIPDETVS